MATEGTDQDTVAFKKGRVGPALGIIRQQRLAVAVRRARIVARAADLHCRTLRFLISSTNCSVERS